MKMLSGAIVILAAAILFAAQWIGKVMHNSAVTGSDEARSLTVGIVVLGGVGAVAMIAGAFNDRNR